jgi:hypothetical protein
VKTRPLIVPVKAGAASPGKTTRTEQHDEDDDEDDDDE